MEEGDAEIEGVEAAFGVATPFDDLGDLIADEEAAPLKVGKLVGHPLEAELGHVRHGC